MTTTNENSRPVPLIASRAILLIRGNYERDVNQAAGEALEAMGLKPADGWRIDLDTLMAVKNGQDNHG